MYSLYNFELTAVAALLLLVGAIISYLLIKIPMRYTFKFILVPATFILCLLINSSLNNLLGTPIYAYPKGNFVLLYYKPVKAKNGAKKIDLLISQSNVSRLFEIPYSKKNEKKLKEMMEAQKKGRGSVGTFNKNKRKLHVNDDDYDLDAKYAPDEVKSNEEEKK